MGIEIKFNYSFLPLGTVVRKGSRFEPEENTYYLDLGNSSEKGVFDHHYKISINEGKNLPKSTAGLLAEGMENVRANLDINKIAKIDGKDLLIINIVCHERPDFDCYAAVYILQQHILDVTEDKEVQAEKQKILKLLAQYTDAIDSGSLTLDDTRLKSPYAIACVIEDVLRENKNHRAKAGFGVNKINNGIDQESLRRGLELIEDMVKGYEKKKQLFQSRGEELPDQYMVLHSNDLIGSENFKDEKAYLKNDYEKYLYDIGTMAADTRKIKLPVINGDLVEIQEVDALFFKSVPGCKLHKHWARNDQYNSPSGKGFVFTFIPVEDLDENGQPRIHKLPNGEPVNTNRVIISVREGSSVSLLGLGEALEAAELAAEENLIINRNMDINEWRSRQDVRWHNEDWCINVDPWYDGRNHDYTIVDAPGIHHSLLSLEEIMEIAQGFNIPILTDNYTRYFIPFSFSNDFKELCRYFSTDDFENMPIKTDDHYFLAYIEDYLFKSPDQCAYFRFGPSKLDFLTGQLNHTAAELISAPGEDLEASPFRNLVIQLRTAYFSLFKYGTGFLVMDINVYKRTNIHEAVLFVSGQGETVNSIDINNLITLNRTLNRKDVLLKIIKDTVPDQMNAAASMDSFTYCTVDLFPNVLYLKRIKEIAFMLSNQNTAAIGNEAENYFNSRNFYSTCYQSKNGTCLVISNNYLNEKEKIRLRNRFLETDFFILLLSLHQRHVLLNMATELARHSRDIATVVKKVSELRRRFLEFTTRSWFSQITNDEYGMHTYRRWQEIFNNKIIFEEVSVQIAAYDDFNQAQMSKTMEIMSSIFFPMIAFGTIYSFLIDVDTTLPQKVFGHQITYSWVWLGVFALCQFIWLRWLYKWRPLICLKQYLVKPLKKAGQFIKRENTASLSNTENTSSLED